MTKNQPQNTKGAQDTAEPRFNEPLFNENLDITTGILCPSNSKIYEEEPQYNMCEKDLDLTN